MTAVTYYVALAWSLSRRAMLRKWMVGKVLCKTALSFQVHSVWPMVAPPDSLARRNMKDEAAEVVPKRKWYDYKSTSFLEIHRHSVCWWVVHRRWRLSVL
jgi:hypothetical protein